VVRIIGIEPGSIAEELELRIGTRVVRINGERVRDNIDLTFMQAEPELELETVGPDGLHAVLEISQDPGDTLGIVPAPDKIRECSNECVFCFIDGNPPDVRDSLWLRDDDFRLSFTYGSYVTLTNLGPRGMQRLVDQRLSPLYVSVHATEPDVRIRLLKNERAGQIMEDLRFLTDGGLELHTQVVLCPEWNDGAHLERTIEDLYGIGQGIRTLSVVPVGLTKYNLNRPVRLLTPDESHAAVAAVDRIRERARSERGYGWCYAADELFLSAGLELPGEPYYDDLELTENGVGGVRAFLDRFERGLAEVPKLPDRRLRVLTGRSMEPFMSRLAPSLAEATGADVHVRAVANGIFGETVTVAGLLGGRDFLEAVPDPEAGDVVLIPAEALNQDRMFIDSMPLDELRAKLAPAQVVPGYEITEALGAL
jgi:putative radical SAM enzyme (TIGR03279 family)